MDELDDLEDDDRIEALLALPPDTEDRKPSAKDTKPPANTKPHGAKQLSNNLFESLKPN